MDEYESLRESAKTVQQMAKDLSKDDRQTAMLASLATAIAGIALLLAKQQERLNEIEQRQSR